MSITNTSKPASPSLSNAERVVSYESWDTITTTWDTETRTWDEMASEMDNTNKVSANITNSSKP
jgi:hypothetical protein